MTQTLSYLGPYRNEVERCIQCGICMPTCPTYAVGKDETLVARGRLMLIKGVLDERLKISAVFEDRISSCIGCFACDAACPREVKIGDIIYAAKAQIAESRGLSPPARFASRVVVGWRWPLPVLLKIASWTSGVYRRIPLWGPVRKLLPFVYQGKKRLLPETGKSSLTSRYPETVKSGWKVSRGRVAFFPGCVINYSTQEMGQAALGVLNKLGYDVVIPRGQSCCGIPLRSIGDEAMAEKVARKNFNLFAGLDVEAVVTACASCGMTLKKEYPKLLQASSNGDYHRVLAFAGKVTDIHEFVDEKRSASDEPDEILLQASQDKTRVTFHDPCHLKRGLGVQDSPRKILKSLPNAEFVEMAEADSCCGFGGIFSLSHYDLSAGIGDRKAGHIRDSGAQVVATGCPGCKIHISDSLNRTDAPTKVVHTMELLDKVLDGSAEEKRYRS
ncbi:MAG: (Fe-S)-binding protein [Nitrospirae bacterium]|nr:(Fe-S)-binding protein [Nitrospirota bacterium]